MRVLVTFVGGLGHLAPDAAVAALEAAVGLPPGVRP